MNITELTFNALWNGLHKSEQDLLKKLEALDAASSDAQAVKASLDSLRIKKCNLEAIAKQNNFCESAYRLDDTNAVD